MTTPSDLKPGIRWWRVLAGALLIELALMVVSLLAYALGRMDDLVAVVPPLTLPIAFLAGRWVARPVARPVLNAALAGGMAAVTVSLRTHSWITKEVTETRWWRPIKGGCSARARSMASSFCQIASKYRTTAPS